MPGLPSPVISTPYWRSRRAFFAHTIGAILSLSLIAGCGGSDDVGVPDNSRYTITELTPLPEGEYDNVANINERGDVVGRSHAGSGTGTHAVLWRAGQPGSPVDLGTLGGDASNAMGLTDNGVVVGQSSLTNNDGTRAFRWENGVMTALPSSPNTTSAAALGIANSGRIIGTEQALGAETPQGRIWVGNNTSLIPTLEGSLYARPHSLNNAGVIVGATQTANADNASHLPFVYDGTTIRALPLLPNATKGSAQGVSSNGLIAGWTDFPERVLRGVLWRNGQAIDLGEMPGYPQSAAEDVNSAGQVVGFSGSDSSGRRAFLWENDSMQDLNALIPANSGWELTTAEGINDRGQVIGQGRHNGRAVSYLLTPRG